MKENLNWFEGKKNLSFSFLWFLKSKTGHTIHRETKMTDFETWVLFCFACEIMGSFYFPWGKGKKEQTSIDLEKQRQSQRETPSTEMRFILFSK